VDGDSSPARSRRLTAAVVGAGPGGLAAAVALRQAGLDVTVYERRSTLDGGGSALTLWPNATSALERLGLEDAVRDCGAPAPGIAILDARGKVLDATGPAVMRQYFGEGGVALLRADLQAVLRAGAGDCVELGRQLVAFAETDDGVVAGFADGHEVRTDLLVGADGTFSTVRGRLADDIPLRYAGYRVWRGIARHPLREQTGTLSLGRGAQFGVFALPAGRVYWFASLSVPETADDLPLEDLRCAFANWHEPIERVLAATAPEDVVVTPVYDADPFGFVARGRVALVGDAAHPSEPTLGQGACQALEDAVVLAACFADGRPVPAALADYDTRRVARTNALVVRARQMGAMGQWRNAVACGLRDFVLSHTPARVQIRELQRLFTFELESASSE
jgi:2-polyprenyl-6-methoxyphenol hydroxylase-like FAD-dependent oxidoreductase